MTKMTTNSKSTTYSYDRGLLKSVKMDSKFKGPIFRKLPLSNLDSVFLRLRFKRELNKPQTALSAFVVGFVALSSPIPCVPFLIGHVGFTSTCGVEY